LAEFLYRALGKNGHKEEGVIQAPTSFVAGHLLKEQGLLPTEIYEKKAGNFLSFLRNISTVPLEEKINVVENLGIMLKAGIPVSRALQILIKQIKNSKLKAVMAGVYNQVQAGKSLSDAMAEHPEIFSNIFISMVRVGDMSGNLEKSLEYLSIQLHREADLKSKVKGAMIYPSVIVSAMVLVGIAMSIFVLPNLISIFKDFKTDLPLMTRIVITFVDFMSGHAFIVIGLLIALVMGVLTLYRTYQGKKAFQIFFLHFFSVNTIIKKINLARFARVLSSLLKSGIPIVQALEVSSDSLSNLPYKELTARAATEVKLGKTLADSLGQDDNLFPPLVVQMLQVGEESGTVEDILNQLAIHYEEEVDTILRNLSSIIEPLLLLVIGAVVGVLAVALISPIYTISSSIK
jgi:type IV pilus assembly protein PilC